MTIFEMKQLVEKHQEAYDNKEALRSLMNSLRASGAGSSVDAMLGHAMGKEVLGRLPQGTRNALAEKVWLAVVALYEQADDEYTKLENMK